MPSGARATVKPYWVDTRRQITGITERTRIARLPPVAARAVGETTITTIAARASAPSTLAPEASTEPTRRPFGTLVRICSAGSGVAGSSPWCAASSRARKSSAACSGR